MDLMSLVVPEKPLDPDDERIKESHRLMNEDLASKIHVVEGGLTEAIQTAATKPTIQELSSQLPRPLAQFLLARVPAGHMLPQEAAAKILEKKSADGMAIESALLFLQYVFDQTAPDPAASNWGEKMKERQVLEEFLRDRLKRVLMLPHMRKTAP